jgi:hypothetical protein
LRPRLLDIGERHGVNVEDDLARGQLPEHAVVGSLGRRERGGPPFPLPISWTGELRKAMAGRAATSPAVIPTKM